MRPKDASWIPYSLRPPAQHQSHNPRILLERFRICEGVAIGDVLAMYYARDRDLHFFSADRVGDRGDLFDVSRHVAPGGALDNLLLDLRRKLVVERHPLAKYDEQADINVRVRRPLADHHAVNDRVHRLDLSVYLRCADAHAAGVERRVGSAVDDHPAALGDLDEVTVMPDVRISLEIRSALLAAVLIIPEPRRLRRERRTADQLPLGADHGFPMIIERPNVQAQSD